MMDEAPRGYFGLFRPSSGRLARWEVRQHKVEDEAVHVATASALGKVLTEIQAVGTSVAELKQTVAPLDLLRPDLTRQVDDRRFRLRVLRGCRIVGVALAGFIGILGALAGVATVSTTFSAWFKWLIP